MEVPFKRVRFQPEYMFGSARPFLFLKWSRKQANGFSWNLRLRICIYFSVLQQPRSGLDRLFVRFLNHPQLDTHACARGETPLNDWSARRTGRYLYNTQQTKETNVHAPSGIRNRDPTNRAAAYALDVTATGVGTRDINLKLSRLAASPKKFYGYYGIKLNFVNSVQFTLKLDKVVVSSHQVVLAILFSSRPQLMYDSPNALSERKF